MSEVGERGEGKKIKAALSTHPGLVSRRIGTFVKYTTRKTVTDGIDRRQECRDSLCTLQIGSRCSDYIFPIYLTWYVGVKGCMLGVHQGPAGVLSTDTDDEAADERKWGRD